MEVKRPIIELMLKSRDVEFMKNYSNEFYGPLRSNDETKNDDYSSILHVSSVIGILMIIFTNFNFEKEKLKNKVVGWLKSPASRELAYILTCFIVSLIFIPFAMCIALAFKIYRQHIENRLKSDKSSRFKGFLVGEDTFWVCEDDHSKSIINVLAYVSTSDGHDEKLQEKLLESIRNRIYAKLMLTNQFPKMFYRRKRDESGYFYWTDESYLTINDYVRYLDDSKEKFISEDDLKEKMSSICNDKLPANDTALWECLISRQAMLCGNDAKYPVIFRVHHSVGDGVALLRLFLEALADKEDVNFEENPVLTQIDTSLHKRLMRLLSTIVTIVKSPSVLCSQAMKQIDINNIHPTKLSGNKKINWIYESGEHEMPLLTAVKLLKRKFPGSRFSNILLAALSKSLRDYFASKNFGIPKDMTVVIPARVCHESPQLRLQNKFSVALQTIPIDVSMTNDRVDRVRRNSDIVISSPDYHINYFLMSVVAGIFPDWVLKAIIISKHATMAVSNLPGPNFTLKINGFGFESVGFFIPNVGQTACGITILSYNNKLHFGAMADENSVESVEDLGIILKGMVGELREMATNIIN